MTNSQKLSIEELLFPLGTVIRHKRFRGRFGRIKPRYLVYFGRLAEFDVHIFFTTTGRVEYYSKGKRKTIPHYPFPEGHPCFRKACVLDVEVVYLVSKEEVEGWRGEIEVKGRLTKKEFKECLRVITYNNPHLDRLTFEYLRKLLFMKDELLGF